jgi:hypothetical protein
MSKIHRLQVMFDEEELSALRAAASADGLTVSEWVRSTLRAEQRRRGADRTSEKLEVLNRALAHDFPAPDIDQMLEEISRGRDLAP